jgi:hypothetical protein
MESKAALPEQMLVCKEETKKLIKPITDRLGTKQKWSVS